MGYLLSLLSQNVRRNHISHLEAARQWITNYDKKIELYSLRNTGQFIKSDTVFILGGGPSLNSLNPEMWSEIRKHDSFGINWSFLKTEVIPTFYQTEINVDKEINDIYLKEFSKCRKNYKETLIFLSTKSIARFYHPRLLPNHFPETPKICRYRLPVPLNINSNSTISDREFNRTVSYRGSVSLILDIVIRLGYKKIVVVGIDLNTTSHFYDDIPGLENLTRRHEKWLEKIGLKNNANSQIQSSQKAGIDSERPWESMIVKAGKMVPMDVYLEQLCNYLKRRRNIELFVSSPDNSLCPRIPAYFQKL